MTSYVEQCHADCYDLSKLTYGPIPDLGGSVEIIQDEEKLEFRGVVPPLGVIRHKGYYYLMTPFNKNNSTLRLKSDERYVRTLFWIGGRLMAIVGDTGNIDRLHRFRPDGREIVYGDTMKYIEGIEIDFEDFEYNGQKHRIFYYDSEDKTIIFVIERGQRRIVGKMPTLPLEELRKWDATDVSIENIDGKVFFEIFHSKEGDQVTFRKQIKL